MYFDFYEDRPDYLAVTREYARLERLLHLIIAFGTVFLLDILAVIALIVVASMPRSPAETRDAQRAALLEPPQAPRFVYMAPRMEMPATRRPPARADHSDRDRNALSPERAKDPTNLRPYSRGNTPEFVDQPASPGADAAPADTRAAGAAGQDGQSGPLSPSALYPAPPTASGRTSVPGLSGAPGPLGRALANLQRYVQGDVFDNQGGGGGQPGAAIQFDSKGVEFGPWLRRFVAQIKRNWFIPTAAMSWKGHVVVTFNVHKDGTITDLAVVGPCNIDAFNRAAFGALASSNPTYPLPPEYPAPKAFFTVTFYYNETPPDR